MRDIIADRLNHLWGLNISPDELFPVVNGRHTIFCIRSSTQNLIVKIAATDAEVTSIRNEASVLWLLTKSHGPVPYLLPALNGNSYAEWSEDRIFFVCEKMNGSHVQQTPEGFAAVGDSLALLHDSMDALAPDSYRGLPIFNPHQVVSDSCMRIQEHIGDTTARDRLMRCASYTTELLKNKRADWETPALCHGDAHSLNLLIGDGGTPYWYDFEDCFIGPRVYDVASLIWSTFNNLKAGPLWKSGLAGYAARSTKGNIVLSCIGVFILVRQIWWMGLYASNWELWRKNADSLFFEKGLELMEDLCLYV